MSLKKLSALILSVVLLGVLILPWIASPAAAANVTPSQSSYTVSAQDINSGLFISNRISTDTRVGAEYFMTYTVKSLTVKGQESVHQQGVIGTNVPGVAFPYTTPERGKGGTMNFDRNEALTEVGKTYFIKFTITREGYDYVMGWAKEDDSRYITFTDKVNEVTNNLGYFGVWFDFGFDYYDMELIKVHCYDKYGNDLGVQTNREQVNVYVDYPMAKDTEVEHSYDIKVTDKVLMFIGNKYLPTSDTVYIEYTVKSGNRTKVEQAGFILTDGPYLGFPYLNGYMSYNQFPRDLNTMTPGPLLEEGASYIIRFERRNDRLQVTGEKTVNGKTTLLEMKAEYGEYIKSQNYMGLWLCGMNEHPNSFELVDFKCYDSNKKNLGVWLNLGGEITHYGALENFETLDGIFYNKENNTFIELYNDATAAIVDAEENRKEAVWSISDAMELTVIVGEQQFTYDYLYTHITDSEGKTWNRLVDYTVTFDTGKGSEVAAQTVGLEQGHRAAKPQDPTLEGNTFVCWCTSDGEEYDFDSIVTGSTTLYAKWKNTEYQKMDIEQQEDSSLPMILIGAVVLLVGIVVAAVLILRGKKHAKVK